MLLTIEISRFCGVTNRGLYFLAVLAATLVALVGDLGLSMASLTYGAADRARTAALHGLALAVSLAAPAAGAAILFGFADFWTRTVLKDVSHGMLALLSVGAVPLLYSQIAGALLTGLGRIGVLSQIRAAGSALVPIVTLPAVWISGGSPFWALAAWVASTLALAVAMGLAVLREAPRLKLPSWTDTREIVTFGLKGQIGTVSHYGFLRIDVLFVSSRLGPAAVGIYSLASVIAEKISLVGSAIYAASASRIGGRAREEAAELTAALIRTMLLGLIPAAIVLALFARPLISALFGSDFAPAATPFVLLLPGTICLTLWYVLSLFLIASLRRPGLTTLIQGVALLASIAPYYYAVRTWGTKGAAVVSSGVYVFVFVAGTVALLKLTNLTRRNLLPTGADVRLTWNVLRGGFALLPGRERRA